MGAVDPVGGQHDTVRSGRAGHHGTGRRVRGEEIHGKWDAVCDLMIRGGDRTEDPAEVSSWMAPVLYGCSLKTAKNNTSICAGCVKKWLSATWIYRQYQYTSVGPESQGKWGFFAHFIT